MRYFILSFALLSLFITSDALERKRSVSEECQVSDDGNVVCTPHKDLRDISEDGINDHDDDSYYDDDDDDDYDDDDSDDILIQNCHDSHELCSFWASKGECEANPNYMLPNCMKACNNCHGGELNRDSRALHRVELENERLLEEIKAYGKPQTVEGKFKAESMFVVRKTIDYMKNFVYAKNPTHRFSRSILSECVNNDVLCAFWAALGECEKNIGYMTTKCAPSCQSCSNIDFNNRCPKRSADALPGLVPGELNLMFERIVATAPGNQTEESQLAAKERKVQEDGTPVYTVTVHSRPESPAKVPGKDGKIPVDMKADKIESPWVITLDNFMTVEETDHLIQLGHSNEYKRSTDVGEKLADGSFSAKKSLTRTSENAWCTSKGGCRQDYIASRVMDRIANVTQIPSQNFEDFQLLKYDVGQFYREHHDYIPHQRDRACGPRILTFFLYLNDVEEGGGTGIRVNNLVISPKKGRALLWPSVLNADPSAMDGRTRHEALTVVKGMKYAANAWIHLYDVVETQKIGCT